MSSNPSEFARRVLDAFEEAGHATDEEVGDAGGPSTTTLAKYRKVASGEMSMTEPRGDVLRRIDAAAGWELGSARALWRDQRDPAPGSTASIAVASARRRLRERPAMVGDAAHAAWLGERLSEVEERIDLIMERLNELSAAPDELPAAAKQGAIEESGEFNT